MEHKLSDTPLLTASQIGATVERLAMEMDAYYQQSNVLIVGLMNGAFIFLADLCRCIPHPVELAFIRASSYGSSKTSSGLVQLEDMSLPPLQGRRVLLVDDILDTGNTLSRVKAHLESLGALDVKLCVLLDKPSRRQVDIQADFCGFQIEDHFVVGYGLDFAEKYRNLPEIRTVIFEDEKTKRHA